MSYSNLSIYEKLLRSIRDRKREIEQALCYGPIADYVVFREQRAKLHELHGVEQELKSLLDKMVQND